LSPIVITPETKQSYEKPKFQTHERNPLLLALLVLPLLLLSPAAQAQSGYVLIPMDDSQRNHLKAYGVMFQHLQDGNTGKWLLNYRGGSFMAPQTESMVRR
jgi:hypothetical protein